MDFTTMGINTSIVGAIIAATKVLTSLIDPSKKLERWYILVPTTLALLAALLRTQPLNWQDFGLNALIFAATSTFAYKFGKTVVLGD